MGIKNWGCWTVTGLVFGYCVGLGAVAQGQEVHHPPHPNRKPEGGENFRPLQSRRGSRSANADR